MTKISLGTAQFGLDYGVSNDRGIVRPAEICEILKYFFMKEGEVVDTAPAYGTSQKVLGQFLSQYVGRVKVVSKFSGQSIEGFREQFCTTLADLGLASLYGYILHDFSLFEKDGSIWNMFKELKDEKLVTKIGFSLYHPAQAQLLIDQDIDFDLLQIPMNIFDRRFESILPVLKKRGVEIHVRSIFLQGLFFLNHQDLPECCKSAGEKIEDLRKIAQTSNLPLSTLLVKYISENPHVDQLVLGVESLENLEENFLAEQNRVSQQVLMQLNRFEESDLNVILPYLWK